MIRALTHPRLKCSVEIAKALGARRRLVGDGWPLGTMLIAADDGSFWLTPLDPDAWRAE